MEVSEVVGRDELEFEFLWRLRGCRIQDKFLDEALCGWHRYIHLYAELIVTTRLDKAMLGGEDMKDGRRTDPIYALWLWQNVKKIRYGTYLNLHKNSLKSLTAEAISFVLWPLLLLSNCLGKAKGCNEGPDPLSTCSLCAPTGTGSRMGRDSSSAIIRCTISSAAHVATIVLLLLLLLLRPSQLLAALG